MPEVTIVDESVITAKKASGEIPEISATPESPVVPSSEVFPATPTIAQANKKPGWPRIISTIIFLVIVGWAGYFWRHQIISYFAPEHNLLATEQSASSEKKILYWVDSYASGL